MALAVGGNEEEPLISVDFFVEDSRVNGVFAEIGSFFCEFERGGAALLKVFEGIGRRPAAVGNERARGLSLIGAVGNDGEDEGVDFRGGFFAVSGRGSLHDLLGDEREEKTFGESEVLGDLGDRPAIGAGLEVPLGVGEAGGSVEHSFASGIEMIEQTSALGR